MGASEARSRTHGLETFFEVRRVAAGAVYREARQEVERQLLGSPTGPLCAVTRHRPVWTSSHSLLID